MLEPSRKYHLCKTVRYLVTALPDGERITNKVQKSWCGLESLWSSMDEDVKAWQNRPASNCCQTCAKRSEAMALKTVLQLNTPKRYRIAQG